MLSAQAGPAHAADTQWPTTAPAGAVEEATTGGRAGSFAANEQPFEGPALGWRDSITALRLTPRMSQQQAAPPGLRRAEQHLTPPSQPREKEEEPPYVGWEAGEGEEGAEQSVWEQELVPEEASWDEGEEEGWGPPEEAVPERGPAEQHVTGTSLRPTAQPFVPSWASR